MSSFGEEPPRIGSANTRPEQENTHPPTNLVDDLLQLSSAANLARGVVWADVLASIAADEEARRLRDAA